eukprot:COSAG05_NODE_5089_length_1265_cov_12.121784_2_plen_162_part_00
MCNKGQTLTGTRFEGKDYAPPVGNRPSWMCLDENLNADWARAELHLCAVTSDLDDDDERKASLATPAAAARTMHRAWEMAPTGPRIVEDILRYPPALQDVIDVGGAEVPDKERRKGRRSTILLPAPPGLEDVVEERKAKYMVWLESDEEDSSSEDESSSDE